MTVLSKKCRLVYYPVPKVACTTAKLTFYALDHPNASAPRRAIHQQPGYQSDPLDNTATIPSGYETVALIRDPVLRLRSAWSNKVNTDSFRRWRQKPLAIKAGLPLDPDFSTFIQNFDIYCEISRAARVHTRPHCLYLGGDLAAIDHVFKIKDIAEFFDLLSARSNTKVTPAHANRAISDKRDNSITALNIDQLRKITARDYDLMRGYFEFDAAIELLATR